VGTRRKMSATVVTTAALLALASVSGFVAASSASAATSSQTPLAGSLVSSTARQTPVGAVASSAQVDFDVVLKLRDAAGAQAELKAVSSPGSSSFRHYLTAAQWESKFSPTASQVSAVSAWLRSEGFTVGAVSKDRITISASGTAAQVEKAFSTGLEYYKVNGQVVRLATTQMSVPASIAGSITGAMGVNQNLATPDDVADTTAATSASAPASEFPPPPPAFITAPPCGTYYGQKTTLVQPPYGHGYPATVPDQVCGYKPGQFRSAYDISKSTTGKGYTVAIIDAYGSATIASDATHYFTLNDPGNPFANAHFSQLLATPFTSESVCGSWSVEQAIDVEAVHSMAGNAHILYVGAKSCYDTDLFNAEQTVVDNGLANVVTNSWGDDAGDLFTDAATKAAFDSVFLLAGGTGIGVQFSSGDNGDNFDLFGLSSSDYPTESPYVTSVGGTTLQIGSKGQQTGQLGWSVGRSFKCTANAVGELPGCTAATLNTWLPASLDGESGGFTSYNYTQPFYQASVVPADLALRNEAINGPVPYRVNPDISMDADPATGFLIGLTELFPDGSTVYGQTRYGGTSLASPLLAGVIADVDQAAGVSVGFINPAIYRLVNTPGAITDIVPGGLQGQYRTDHAFTYISGAKGFLYQFREITFEGLITYCDATGNCVSRLNTLTTAPGYDSMTGLGAPGPNFVADLAG
jgi:subtilase family serine protease